MLEVFFEGHSSGSTLREVLFEEYSSGSILRRIFFGGYSSEDILRRIFFGQVLRTGSSDRSFGGILRGILRWGLKIREKFFFIFFKVE